jgi:hypothetical protein
MVSYCHRCCHCDIVCLGGIAETGYFDVGGASQAAHAGMLHSVLFTASRLSATDVLSAYRLFQGLDQFMEVSLLGYRARTQHGISPCIAERG